MAQARTALPSASPYVDARAARRHAVGAAQTATDRGRDRVATPRACEAHRAKPNWADDGDQEEPAEGTPPLAPHALHLPVDVPMRRATALTAARGRKRVLTRERLLRCVAGAGHDGPGWQRRVDHDRVLPGR